MESVYLVQNFFLGSLVVWFLVWSGFVFFWGGEGACCIFILHKILLTEEM